MDAKSSTPSNGLDNKFAVVGFLHRAIFPNNHRGHRFCALDMGDVEALDAFRQIRQTERVLQGLLDLRMLGFITAETLIVRLLCVRAARSISERFSPRCGTSM